MKTLVITTIAALTFVTSLSAAEVDRRQHRQQERVAQGVASGRLTPGETAKIEGQEASLRHEIHNDRAANGGKLTPKEKVKVNRQENRLSREIYNKKHN